MNSQCTIFEALRQSRVPMICTLLLVLVILGSNQLAYYSMDESDPMELSENQEKESKTAQNEYEDLDEFLNDLVAHRFAGVIKFPKKYNYLRGGLVGYSVVETPPPKQS